ncbi:hypothetical protein HDU85_005298 [Gaertneriomyces sp. JEL0708]|nr:hypothetical protein HDU85_005298 [Gaertneriomyces sp. JEL0708]
MVDTRRPSMRSRSDSFSSTFSYNDYANGMGSTTDTEVFDDEGNMRPNLPGCLRPGVDADGNPTLLAADFDSDGQHTHVDDETGKAGMGQKPPPIHIPDVEREGNSHTYAEDFAAGTSTEEDVDDFLESEYESELLAAEKRAKDRKARRKSMEGKKKAGIGYRWYHYLGGMPRGKSYTWMILRWPLLMMFSSFIIFDLVMYIIVRQWVRLYEWITTRFGQFRKLYRELREAPNYETYKHAARTLDKYMKTDQWKRTEKSPYYDYDLVHRTVRRLRRHRERLEGAQREIDQYAKEGKEPPETLIQQRIVAVRDLKKILEHGGIKSNFANVENEALYSHTYLGTKAHVEEYISEACASLKALQATTVLPVSEKREFFRKASRAYGKTALCLSGGATLGYYHFGVAKALFESGLLPQIITGTSSGSLVAALICCRTDEELRDELFQPSIYKVITACEVGYWDRFKSLLRTGAAFSHSAWYTKTVAACKGPLTFLEAYQRTGRILNIAIVPDEPHSPFKLCNYITTPNVIVATAVLASSAVPGVLNPIELLMKTESGQIVPFTASGRRWRDGSLMMDIPERELHRLFGVTFTVVSQVNPHISLFFFEKRGSAGVPVGHRWGMGWRGGFLSSLLVQSLKLSLLSNLSLLKDFDLLPRVLGTDIHDVFLQKFEGSVTILPQPRLMDYKWILEDPDEDRMKYYLKEGQSAAFPKINMILSRQRLERTLWDCRKSIEKMSYRHRGSTSSTGMSARWSSGIRSPRWWGDTQPSEMSIGLSAKSPKNENLHKELAPPSRNPANEREEPSQRGRSKHGNGTSMNIKREASPLPAPGDAVPAEILLEQGAQE